MASSHSSLSFHLIYQRSIMHTLQCFLPSSSLSFYNNCHRFSGPCFNQVPQMINQQNPIFLHHLPLMSGARHRATMVMKAGDNNEPETPASAKLSNFSWKKWMVAIIFSMIPPCFKYRSNWGPLLALKMDETIETVDLVRQVVEEVAEQVEKVSDEAADKLPDNTMLKKAEELVENLAEETATKAEQAEELIHKGWQFPRSSGTPQELWLKRQGGKKYSFSRGEDGKRCFF